MMHENFIMMMHYPPWNCATFISATVSEIEQEEERKDGLAKGTSIFTPFAFINT